VFPTHVGMNRTESKPGKDHRGVPHTRGDEPKG